MGFAFASARACSIGWRTALRNLLVSTSGKAGSDLLDPQADSSRTTITSHNLRTSIHFPTPCYRCRRYAMRYVSLALSITGIMFGQSWQTAVDLPSVDLSGLSDTLKSAAPKTLREQDCNCGCNLKIAECRVKDPNCSYSRALAAGVVREFKAGKSADQVYAVLREMQKQGPVK